MKIKSIYIENLKGLSDFTINFNNNVNAIIGENGLGKTTLLDAIYDMLSGYGHIRKDDSFKGCRTNVYFTDEEIGSMRNLGSQVFENVEEISLNKEGFNKTINFIQCGSSADKAKELNWFNKIVYLPTDVNFKKYKVETPKRIEVMESTGVVLNSENMAVNLKEYLVNIHYKDLEDLSLGDKPYRIEKFRKLYNSFLEEKEFVGVKDFEPIFRIKETGETHSADELSAGEKQIFFRGGSLLKMNLNNSVILIDEPELSLHPEWQQKILDFYKGIGENNQIIIATHSPHIISSCKKEEVIVLEKKSGKTVVKETIEETYGWTVEQLLLSVFGLKSVRNPDMKEKLDKFKNLYINRDNLNNEQLLAYKTLKKDLEKYLDPEDPSLSLISIKEDTNKLESLLQKLKANK